MRPNLQQLTTSALLSLHVEIGEELRSRGVVRSANNPTGDLAEHLFCTAFRWTQAPNSERGYDAVDVNGTRYQIKGRRVNRRNKSRQLSAIRNLDECHFDILAGVLFDENYTVIRAALIPRSTVEAQAKYIAHTNSHKFMLRDEIWSRDEVKDVTDTLRAVTL